MIKLMTDEGLIDTTTHYRKMTLVVIVELFRDKSVEGQKWLNK